MVAIIAGGGLGLDRSSAWVLGSRGQVGASLLGRGGDNVYVNAATGNLLIQNTDEMLIGLGQNDVISRAYNSQGALNDDNGDNWRAGVSRNVALLSGTVGTVGSTVKRTDWDGSEVVFSWNAGKAAYVAKETAGAYDTITLTGSTWTWTDGASRVSETYDNANSGRITTRSDADGNTLTYAYNAAGLVSRVTTQSGEFTDLSYSGNDITQIVTSRRAYNPGTGLFDAALTTLTRVRYGYDATHRLTSVTVDLSPTDNSISDNKIYVTTYTYDLTSARVASITQSDGSSLTITYAQIGGTGPYRVASYVQNVVAGTTPVTRTTTFAYDTVLRETTVTDPLGLTTKLAYDVSGQLIKTTSGAAQITQFGYNTAGDVTTVTAPDGSIVTYGYDANGNRTSELDAQGNSVTRTFGSNNQVLTETRYLAAGATSPVTVRYAYDVENHLRFMVSAEGNVTEYRYNAPGQQTSLIQYAKAIYDVSALAPTATLTEATLATWVTGVTDLTATKRTDTTYDFRGNVAGVTAFGKVLATGLGDTSGEYSTTTYVYDQFGKLLSRLSPTAPQAEVSIYDGLGRLTATTDFAAATTQVVFNDAASTTTVTLTNGLTRTSTYNLAGDLISYVEAGSGVTSATTLYAYDADGRLGLVTDPTGNRSYSLYDNAGRKVADIKTDGSLTEYGYTANDLLNKTIQYNTKLNSTQLASLVNASGQPTNVALATVRPIANAADRWDWRIYDAAQRLIEVIDPSGAATVYSYDNASRLAGTTGYATFLSGVLVTGFKTTVPTTLQTPVSSATDDRVTRNFYDKDDRLVGVLDAEGYLTQTKYDAAGQGSETVKFATVVPIAQRSAGTLSQLLASVGTAAADIHNWFLYDARGLTRAAIDGEGNLTRYHYTALGDLDQVIAGQKLDPAVLLVTPPTLATLPSAGATLLDTTNFTRDAFGMVLTEVKSLSGGGTETLTYKYDNQHRLIDRTTTTSVSAETRTFNQVFDARGRLIRDLNGVGAAVLQGYGAAPTQLQIDDTYQKYGTIYTYDAADRLISKTEPNGVDGAGLKTLYYYDANGRLTYMVNAAGEVTKYDYNSFGQRSDITAFITRIPTAGLTGGAVVAVLTGIINDPANDSHTHLDFNVTGTVSASVDALSASASYTYDAFGGQLSRIDPVAAGQTIQTTRTFDRRGQLKTEIADAAVGGLQLNSAYVYDAFGRATQMTDAAGQVRSTGYDRAGRTITTTDALGQQSAYTYDGRGSLLTTTDRLGKITNYAYTAFNRQVTVTTPEGVVTTRTTNAYGQTLTITDGAGRITTWTYDKDGHVKTVNDGVNTTTNTYDLAGRLFQMQDARGVITQYSFDAVSRVLSRIVDPGALNTTTTYGYDAQGRQTTVTDGGVSSSITYDRNGRKTQVVVNPGWLSLTTTYAYDQRGRALTLTEAVGSASPKTTQYAYDKADRLVSAVVDPGLGKLNLTTTYAYDAVGNVVAKTDAAGGVTRYVYDAENRQVYAIDGVGDVVRTSYDAEGRVAGRYAYANIASLTGWPLAVTAATVAAAVVASASDEVMSYVYDNDGRLKFMIDAIGFVTEQAYDGAGNVLHRTVWGQTITQTATYTVAYVQAQIALEAAGFHVYDRTTRYAYDNANRLTFSIDALGGVTALSYDGANNAVKTVRYATAYGVIGDQSTGALQAWAAVALSASDRVTRTVYDNAGRAAYGVDGENYITEWQYDGGGRVTAQIRYNFATSVTDGVTQANLKALLLTNQPTTPPNTPPAQTTYAYDAAGRLTDTFTDAGYKNPNGSFQASTIQAHLVLDALGQVTDRTVAYGTMEATTTHNVYDVAGRMLSQTAAYGAAEASTTSYTYDGLGRVRSLTDGDGFTTFRLYDAAGRMTQESKPFDAVTNTYVNNTYDAFGNLVKVVDPRNNAGYFFYDKLNRQTFQVDPEGYVTETRYWPGGKPSSVIRYANRAANAASVSVSVPPTISPAAADATSSYWFDNLDRMTASTDAQGATEYYTLNAYGDRISVTNRLGGVTTNTYDHRGQLLSETLPIQSVLTDGTVESATVSNTFQYDARGNRTVSIEGVAANLVTRLTDSRMTLYIYDQLDRQVRRIGDDVTNTVAIAPIGGYASAIITPTEFTYYDRRGNIIEFDNQAGGRTLYYYDGQNRRTAQVGAVGGLTTWTFDGAGNATAMRAYGDSLSALPATPGGAAPPPVNPANYRETLYTFDRANRQVGTRVQNVTLGSGDNTSYATTTADVVTRSVYDAAGNVIQQIDGRTNSTFYFYDKLGRKIAQVDAANYLTTYALDAEGNVTKEERLATKLTASVTATSDPTALRAAAVTDAANDRITTFTYDKNGRRLTETRKAVLVTTISASGAYLGTVAGDTTITYTYNGLGQVLTKTEATLDQTVFTYDLGGRLTSETNAAFLNLNALTRQHQSLTYYDGLNNVTRNWVGAAGISTPATDRVTTYTYGPGGRMASMFDAEGFVRSYGYDGAGRVTLESYSRAKSDGSLVSEANAYHYDLAGRVDAQGSGAFTGTGFNTGEITYFRYNAYGQLAGKGQGATWITQFQETYDYDKSGRMWRSTAGDGSIRLYVYDANGNQTLMAQSSGGGDLSGAGNIDSEVNFLNALGPIGTKVVSGQVLTISIYDARNQLIKTREPMRDLYTTATTELNSSSIERSKTYNAFGEVATETNPNNGLSTYTYNTLGKVILSEKPQVSYTNGQGIVGLTTSPETTYYDASGRVVGRVDARGNLTTRTLLASSGYGGSEALATAEFRLGGAAVEAIKYGYDAFYNLRTIANELNTSVTPGSIDILHTEQRSYDRMGRLTVLTRPTKLFTQLNQIQSHLDEFYAYDGLGQRIRHTNSIIPAFETTDYDAQGRVIRTADFMGVPTTTAYVWSNSITTQMGLNTNAFGGWTKTTTYPSGKTSIDTLDYFGRTVGHTDMGGQTYLFAFDMVGRLTYQGHIIGLGQSLSYTYYNTGALAKLVDAPNLRPIATSTYTYDKAGNRLTETYGDSSGISYQNAVSTYDAQNRMLHMTDGGRAGAYPITVDFTYTAGGDIRRMQSSFTNVPGATGGPTSQDYWYAYDAMSRVTVAKGKLIGGQIVRDLTGVSITYDAAGQRATSVRTTLYSDLSSQKDFWIDHQESYLFDNNGYLKKTVTLNSYLYTVGSTTNYGYDTNQASRAYDLRDEMGRVYYHGEEFDQNTGVYARNLTYNNRSEILTEDTYTNQADGSQIANHTTFDYNILGTNGYNGAYQGGVVTHSNTTSTRTPLGGSLTNLPSSDTVNAYLWFDGARQSQITITPSSGAVASTALTYDANAHLTGVVINDGRPRTVSYVTDASGQVLERWEGSGLAPVAAPVSTNPIQFYYDFNGVRVGDVGNNGSGLGDYAAAIAARQAPAQVGAFQGGAAQAAANFDNGYDPITSSSQGEQASGASSYTVRDGDSLRTIAKLFWGDESLWWLIADANGLTGAEPLAAGRLLTVPAKVTNVHNKASTFRVYDPNQAIGDISPTAVSQPSQPAPPKKKGCGGIGAIIVAIVAVVVTAIVAPYAIAAVSNVLAGATSATAITGTGVSAALAGSTATAAASAAAAALGTTAGAAAVFVGGALAGAAGSIIGQGLGVATGLQSKFDWSGVALAAISAGVSGGLDKLLPGSGIVRSAVRGAAGNAITQGVAVATGLQQRFDWTGVAVGAVVSGAGAAAATYAPAGLLAGVPLRGRIIPGAAGAIAGAATRSLINGSDFGDNIRAVLPDVIAATLGDSVGEGLKAAASAAFGGARPIRLAALDPRYEPFMSGGGSVVLTSYPSYQAIARPAPTDFLGRLWSDLSRGRFTAALGDLGGLARQTFTFTPPQAQAAGSNGQSRSAAGGVNEIEELVVTARRNLTSLYQRISQDLTGATKTYLAPRQTIGAPYSTGGGGAGLGQGAWQRYPPLYLPPSKGGVSPYFTIGGQGYVAYDDGSATRFRKVPAGVYDLDQRFTDGRAAAQRAQSAAEIDANLSSPLGASAAVVTRMLGGGRVAQGLAFAAGAGVEVGGLLGGRGGAQPSLGSPRLAYETVPSAAESEAARTAPYNISTAGMTGAERQAVIDYAQRSNAWLDQNGGTTAQATAGTLRSQANAAARLERLNAARAGTPYQGQAGHVPDTALTGTAQPPAGWLDMPGRSNSVVGGGLSSRIGQRVDVITVDGKMP